MRWLGRVGTRAVAFVVVAVCRLLLWKERVVAKEVSLSEQAYARRLFRMKCGLRFGVQDGLCDSLGRAGCKGLIPCGKETNLGAIERNFSAAGLNRQTKEARLILQGRFRRSEEASTTQVPRYLGRSPK